MITSHILLFLTPLSPSPFTTTTKSFKCPNFHASKCIPLYQDILSGHYWWNLQQLGYHVVLRIILISYFTHKDAVLANQAGSKPISKLILPSFGGTIVNLGPLSSRYRDEIRHTRDMLIKGERAGISRKAFRLIQFCKYSTEKFSTWPIRRPQAKTAH